MNDQLQRRLLTVLVVFVIHVATIPLEAEGQAFAWAQDGTRTVFTIDRRKGLVRAIAIPEVTVAMPHALAFR